MAKLAPENPEFMPPLGPSEFDAPVHFSENTAAAGAGDLLPWLRPVVEHSRSSGVSSAGFLVKSARRSATATSEGLYVQQPSSGCNFTMTARIDEGRGERWFCSEAEARAAGWRAPRR